MEQEDLDRIAKAVCDEMDRRRAQEESRRLDWEIQMAARRSRDEEWLRRQIRHTGRQPGEEGA